MPYALQLSLVFAFCKRKASVESPRDLQPVDD